MSTKFCSSRFLIEDNCVYALNSRNSNRFYCFVQKGYDDRKRRITTDEVNATARLFQDSALMYDLLRRFADVDRHWDHKAFSDAAAEARSILARHDNEFQP